MNFIEQVFHCINQEAKRQHEHLELIASENYTSEEILKAAGSILTNKYAEGYPGKRYYGGCAYVDKIETIAIEQAKALFECQYANVQPHSGSSANAAVFQALLEPGDTIMGLSLEHGGHLTHGSSVNFSGKNYKAVPYQTDDKGFLDYDKILEQALEEKPKMIIAGFSAYSREVHWERFREIADRVGAIFLADMAHLSGLIAAKAHPSPLPWADVVTSTTHKTLRGPRGGLILSNNPDNFKKLDKSIFPGTQGGPLMHVIAGKAICFAQAREEKFKKYINQVLKNAQALSGRLREKGHRIVTDGTDTHLFLVSLLTKEYSGKDLEIYFESAGITLNKNTVPGETRSPFVTSGLRIGTAALTTRGMQEKEMVQIADYIHTLMQCWPCPDKALEVKNQIKSLCDLFPVS